MRGKLAVQYLSFMKLRLRSLLVALILALWTWPACSTPQTPVIDPTPTPTPTPVVNTPPTIRSVTVSLTRARAEGQVSAPMLAQIANQARILLAR